MQGGGGGAPDLGGPMPSLDLTKISYAAMGGDAEPMPKQEVQDLPDYDSDTSEDMDGMMAAVAKAEERYRVDAEARRAREERERAEREARAVLEREQQERIQADVRRLNALRDKIEEEQRKTVEDAHKRVEEGRARQAELRVQLEVARAQQSAARVAEVEAEQARATEDAAQGQVLLAAGQRRLVEELAAVQRQQKQAEDEHISLLARRAREAEAFVKFESDLKQQADREAAELMDLKKRRQELMERISAMSLGAVGPGATPPGGGGGQGGGRGAAPVPGGGGGGAGGGEEGLSWKEKQELRWQRQAEERAEWERKQREWEEQKARGGGATTTSPPPVSAAASDVGADDSHLSWKERQELRWKKRAEENAEWERKQREWEQQQQRKSAGAAPAPPTAAPVPSLPPAGPAAPPPSAATAGVGSTWECKLCFQSNAPAVTACRVCQRERPGAPAPAPRPPPDVFAALRSANMDVVRSLLARDPSLARAAEPPGGDTLLAIACQLGRRDAVEQLLGLGADVNARNAGGNTPLHFCFSLGHLELGDFLISRGADDNIENSDGLTPYDC